ncbi:MAG TPA: glycogen debranching enzyme N-terminal domain-containing protein, partial [Vicinamibacterales bacterium]|nr:glycogen debranching enzyme N-terminal domain-containing protein [Vicinamibacterales bacterium]
MKGPVQSGWRRGEPREALLEREWLVTNGLGGYACGTIGGACTRRFHGKLIAAMPAPLGRTMMLNHLEEHIGPHRLSGDEHGTRDPRYPDLLEEFVLECGTPVWRYAAGGIRLEKRVVMPYSQNTTYILYRLLEGPPGLTLQLRPSLKFRPHEGLLAELSDAWQVSVDRHDIEIVESEIYPPLRIALVGPNARFEHDPRVVEQVIYRIEQSRGYEHEGPLWSPGEIHIELARGEDVGIVASVETWDVIHA